jgi:hypothetical protein
MLKKICTKKLIISIIILSLITILYKIPDKNDNNKITKKISYVNYELKNNEIYLLDKNNYLTRIKIPTNNEGNKLVEELINILNCNNTSKIPNGLKCILNSNTKINNINIKNNTLKIDLSKDLLDVDESLEEKSIEALVYSLTSIDGINNIIIYIDGKILSKLPKSNTTLPSTLNREFGINKKYNLTNTQNISKTTIYYVNKTNDNIFYTPITLISNDTREKIEIIIDELSNKLIDNNLNSYLNSDTKVLNSRIENNTMYINFNENILDGFDNNDILEEVIYTISLSINDNYDIKNVFFDVNNKEIAKTTIKSLE